MEAKTKWSTVRKSRTLFTNSLSLGKLKCYPLIKIVKIGKFVINIFKCNDIAGTVKSGTISQILIIVMNVAPIITLTLILKIIRLRQLEEDIVKDVLFHHMCLEAWMGKWNVKYVFIKLKIHKNLKKFRLNWWKQLKK